MDIPPLPRARLFLRLLFAPLSNRRTDRPAGNSSRKRISGRNRRIAARSQPLLVRAIALLVLGQFAHAHGDHLARPARRRLRLLQSLAAPQPLRLLRLLSLVCLLFERLLQLPIGRHAPRGRLPLALPCAARPASRLGREAPAHPRKLFPLALGVVPYLLRIRPGEMAQRRSPMASPHRPRRLLPERPAAQLDRLVRRPSSPLVSRRNCGRHAVNRIRRRADALLSPPHPNHLFLYRHALADRHHPHRQLHVSQLPGACIGFSSARRQAPPPLRSRTIQPPRAC